MYNEELMRLLFAAAHTQRWNDHARAHNFTELDKQAHKMTIAYVLARHEEDAGNKIDWLKIIEGGICEFLHRIVLTDIKPPVFYLLQDKYREQINNWVATQLQSIFADMPAGFEQRFEEYLNLDSADCIEKSILQAAHYLATRWEFRFIYDLNRPLYGIEETKESLDREIERYYGLESVRKIVLYKRAGDFISLVGQLRFQKRWAQIPRVPETSVLGHMLMVAVQAYLFSMKELAACPRRVINNFYAGLFHDLPEVLTRDIISPVKRSVAGLDEIIKNIEGDFMNSKIYPLLPEKWHRDIRYYTENEFATKITGPDGQVKKIIPAQMAEYNSDEYNPLDGEMLKFCDNLAAMLEIVVSKQHGMTSDNLERSLASFEGVFKGKKINNIDAEKIADYFLRNMRI